MEPTYNLFRLQLARLRYLHDYYSGLSAVNKLKRSRNAYKINTRKVNNLKTQIADLETFLKNN